MEEKVEDYQDPEVLRRLYWGEGLTPDQIAERLYVSRGTVQYWMRKTGVPSKPVKPYFHGRIDYRDREVLEKLIDQGLTLEQIARRAGVKVCAIGRWKRRLGLTARTKDPARRYEVNGRMMTILEMATEAGLTKSTVAGRLKRGWPPADAMSVPVLTPGRRPEPRRREK